MDFNFVMGNSDDDTKAPCDVILVSDFMSALELNIVVRICISCEGIGLVKRLLLV